MIDRAARRANEAGAKFYFVYLPEQIQFSRGQTGNLSRRAKGKVMSIVESLKIPSLDMTEEFSWHSDPLSLFTSRSWYSHYNRVGYEAVAQACLRRLERMDCEFFLFA